MASNLYEYYKGLGKSLPSTAADRFADPAFASAAQQAGYTPQTYSVNSSNASANQAILANLEASQPGGTKPIPTVANTSTPAQAYSGVLTNGQVPTRIAQDNQPTQPIATYNQPTNTYSGAPAAAYIPPTSGTIPTTVGQTYGVTGLGNPLIAAPMTEEERFLMEANSVSGYNVPAPFDEAAVRAEKLRNMQLEIDAQNAFYAEQRRRLEKEAANRAGQSNIALVKSGLIGSPMQQTIQTEGAQYSGQILDLNEKERLAKIAQIQQQAEKDVTDLIKAEREARATDYDSYIKKLTTRSELKKNLASNAVKNWLAGGVDITKANDSEIKPIADAYGVSVQYLRDLFRDEKSAYDAALAEQENAAAIAELDRQIKEAGLLKTEAETSQIGKPKVYSPEEIAKMKAETSLTYAQAEKARADAKAALPSADTKNSETLGNLSLIDSILSDPYLSNATGIKSPGAAFGGFFGGMWGSNTSKVTNELKQLQGVLSLENRQKLKGSGAISDFEAKTLADASSAFGTNLSDIDAVNQLKKIRGVMATSAGLTATVEIKDPRTGQSQLVDASRDGINKAIADGLLVEYK